LPHIDSYILISNSSLLVTKCIHHQFSQSYIAVTYGRSIQHLHLMCTLYLSSWLPGIHSTCRLWQL